jgi:hypothetical protein
MKNELVKIKLVKRPTFTGTFGRYAFTEGVSELMPRSEAERLAAITTVEFVDAMNMWERKRAERGELVGTRKAEQTRNKAAEQRAAKAAVALPTEPKSELDDAPHTLGKRVYTRSELEDVADSKGIAGLRSIGNPMNARSNTIRGTIDAIMKAQGL